MWHLNTSYIFKPIFSNYGNKSVCKYDLSRLNIRIEFVNSQKDKCAKCGDTRNYILEFHHKDPKQKEFTIGRMRNYSLEKIQKEIDKCIVLCCNCHREFHYLEKSDFITIEQYLEN